MGRPSSYTPEADAEICERLANGESLSAICRDEHMPDRATVARWRIDDCDGFRDRYAQAREEGFERMAEDLVEIADADPGTCDNGATDSGAVAHQRLRVDTRKWLLSKLVPKTYGDRQAIDVNAKVEVATAIVAARKRSGG